MNRTPDFEIFLATFPGLEPVLLQEARLKGFRKPKAVPGGVTLFGGWPDVWRANLWLRTANRVLARIASFRVMQLHELHPRTRRIEWTQFLRPDVPWRVEANCTASKIYHEGAAAERVAQAITQSLGTPPSTDPADALVTIHVRIENNACTISLDTSGELLHRRGYKIAPHRAPLRETMASAFLMQCGYDGQEPLIDPMCGSGTIVLEACEIANRLNPGRARDFAFRHFANFDETAWNTMRDTARAPRQSLCLGRDRDEAAIKAAQANAERCGVTPIFEHASLSTLRPPTDQPGLILTNPPYGTRIGDRDRLGALYNALGRTIREHFTGWRVGIITSEPDLAYATGLNFLPRTAPVPHGGLRVSLFQTERVG